MAREAEIRSSLRIRAGNIDYRSYPQVFFATVTGRKGPVPGAITVSTDGVDVDLSELAVPGLCRISNQDDTNFIYYGVYATDTFYPLGEILPGESYVFRLSRFLGWEVGTGTGTMSDLTTLHIRADTDDCNVLVEAFEA